MQATSTLFGISAFAIAALAQDPSIAFNTFPPQEVVPGSSIDLKYTAPSTSPVSITLLRGCPSNCVPAGDLTTAAAGGSFTWTPSSTLASGCDYGLKISQGSVFNYSNNFCVKGSAAATTSSAAAPAYNSAPVSSAAPVASVSSIAAAGPGAYAGPYISTPAASTPTPTPAAAKYTGAASNAQVGAGAVGLAGVAGIFAML